MVLDEASRNDLAAEASLGSLRARCGHDSIMSRELAAMKSRTADTMCDVSLTRWVNRPLFLCGAVCLIISRWHSSCCSVSAGPFYTQITVSICSLVTHHRNKGQRTGTVSAALAQESRALSGLTQTPELAQQVEWAEAQAGCTGYQCS